MNYNLLEEQWIPVLYRDGRYQRVGIRNALEDAGKIREIAASNPMDRVAILRLLLAVLQWCKPMATQRELEQLRSEATQGIPPAWLKEKLGTQDHPNVAFESRRVPDKGVLHASIRRRIVDPAVLSFRLAPMLDALPEKLDEFVNLV